MTKKKTLLLLCLILAALTASSLIISGTLTSSSSESLICYETVWDGKVVKQSSTPSLQHSFRVHNISQRPVVIKSISADCGCITTKLTNALIQPRSVLVVPITVNTSPLVGSFSRHIHITYESIGDKDNADSANRPHKLTLTVQGYIDYERRVYSTPSFLNYGTVATRSASRVSRTFVLRRYDELPIDCDSLEVTTSLPESAASVRHVIKRQDDGSYQVELILERIQLDVGLHTFEVKVTHGSIQPERKFPLPAQIVVE